VKYSNEFKVGASIVISVIVFILGSRFFDSIPLFRGTYELFANFEDARGMVKGNAVRINGVSVGSVQDVSLDPATNLVSIRIRLDSKIIVPQGSYAEITGIDALSAVQLTIHPGPPGNPPIESGGSIPSQRASDLIATMTERAPELVDRIDSVLVGLNLTLTDTRGIIEPQSDLRLMLASLRGSASELERLMVSERTRLARVLANVDTLTATLGDVAGSANDSLAISLGHLNNLLARMDGNMAQLETTMASLDAIVGKIDRGEGTLGLMINDPSLYNNLDSTVQNMNALLVDFKQNPVRYMKALRLVDVF
jgi:phospholipid/cholesterol/gamma-HCH transport system substrate-binding protein